MRGEAASISQPPKAAKFTIWNRVSSVIGGAPGVVCQGAPAGRHGQGSEATVDLRGEMNEAFGIPHARNVTDPVEGAVEHLGGRSGEARDEVDPAGGGMHLFDLRDRFQPCEHLRRGPWLDLEKHRGADPAGARGLAEA